ncbi:universal stress protein UspA-like protein [Saccharomonospora marina XMU15]|uniref:Universal stress protein UspA-like protein n=1 Tax=Saccharomonospora marina XMU15 TaxID=882083 RepID=H5X2M2_9PSEU|nr:universal stress protein [Saccharomonospora marina]EHR50961.1 universal stress protein UspA-like protein [Saccharomonospora marina XMU15]
MTNGNRAQRPVVAGVDGSPSAMDATRWAARQAARLGEPLRLLYVADLPPLNPHVAAPPPSYASAWLDSGRKWLSEAEDMATDEVPELPVETDVRLGQTSDTLIEESRGAALLVLGTRGYGGFRRLLVGSVASTVAAHAVCPVVVLPAGTATVETGDVVVGADGSALGVEALGFGFDVASAKRARLVAVRAWHESLADAAWSGLPVRDELDKVTEQELRALHADLRPWREKYPDVEVSEHVVRTGKPSDALLDAAQRAQLIVVGSHGRGVVSGTLLGSTSQALLHTVTSCPVAIVRPKE